MSKSKLTYIGIILISFISFCFYISFTNKTYTVLDIRSFNEIGIDLNKNGVIEENEYVSLFSKYGDIHSLNDIEKYNLDNDEIPLIEYLTIKFIKDNLLDKKITIKKHKKEYNIYIDNNNFNEMYYNSGFLFKNGAPISEKSFLNIINNVKNSNYKIYNIKSKKYHSINCKYGKLAHNSIYITQRQLPRDAIGCKFCTETDLNHKTINQQKTPNLIYKENNIKILLTDFTQKLIPDNFGNTNICKELIKNINNAKKSIDIAIYGYEKIPVIENAIKNAISRGVVIRLVRDIDSNNSNIYIDTDYFSKLIKNYNADYPKKNISNTTAYTNSIMHNKFFIFDNNTVITGSANLSRTDMSGFNSNAIIIINSKEIAQIYTNEFEQMYEGKFHNIKKQINKKNRFKLNNSKISVYFSPKDNTISTAIIPLINQAKKYIYIPTFLITDKKVTNALIQAHNRGLDIKLIIDATNAKNNYSKHTFYV